MSNENKQFQDFTDEEKELAQILASVKDEPLSSAVLENFEEDVLRKVYHAQHGLPMGVLVPALGLGFMIFLFALIFVWNSMRVEKESVTPVLNAELTQGFQETKQEMQTPKLVNNEAQDQHPVSLKEEAAKPELSEKVLEELSKDLFILEMLGEDEGLLDDFDRLESDLDFIANAGVLSPGTSV